MTERAKLEIGAGTTIGDYTILDLLDDPNDPQSYQTSLILGERVAINEFNNIRAGGSCINIGDGVLISQYVSIIGTNHSTQAGVFIRDQKWDATKRGVMIGKDVWVGANTVILPGVHIGDGCVIGAGSVVARDIPAGWVAAGAPAKALRPRS